MFDSPSPKRPDSVFRYAFLAILLPSFCASEYSPFQVMDGRFFSGTRVEAYVSEGREKFKKTNERRAALEDMAERGIDAEDEEERQRLDEFGTWLESSHTVENKAK